MPQHHDEPMTLEEYHELAAQARANLAKPVGSRPTPTIEESVRKLRRFTEFALSGGLR